MTLVEARCLDLGTFDGMTAFVMAELGAAEVDATCQYDLNRFRCVAAVGGWTNLKYYPNTEIEDLRLRFGDASFDLVCISAMLHHLVSPLDALFIVRNLTRPKGYLILEAAVHDKPQPVATLNTEAHDPVYGTPTIWIPSIEALEGMVRLASFSVEARIHLRGTYLGRERNYRRVTLLCRAVKPSEVVGRSSAVQAVHRLSPWRHRIDFRELESQETMGAKIYYHGTNGSQSINIFNYRTDVPLQPTWVDPTPTRTSCFQLGTVDRFMELMGKHEAHQWTKKDIYLLSAKYPGETFPEGQAWSLKQFGNLFCLDSILSWEPSNVLEIGPGFNHYFENHLPKWIDYSIIDDEGFYDREIISLSNSHRRRSRIYNGLIGGHNDIKDSSFDFTFSVSVLEHIERKSIESAAADMARILRPGGWSVHSLDVTGPGSNLGRLWLGAFQKAGFVLDSAAIDLDFDRKRERGREIFNEPLSIVQKFHGGYRPKPWQGPAKLLTSNVNTILIAVRKPE
jgi:SAM-dependent methyltransferase